MIRKDVIVAVVTTFCLCSLVFTVIPIRSGNPYDPWADIDENGQINMYDIAYAASRFGAAGDSTKNVTIRDSVFTWYSGEQYITGQGSWASEKISTVGFRQFTVNVYTNSTVYVTFQQQNEGAFMASDARMFNYEFGHTYNVVGTELYIYINNHLDSTALASCSVYMNSIAAPLPSHSEQSLTLNVSSGNAGIAILDCEGYSRLAISAYGGTAASGTYNVTLYMFCIGWATSWEYLSVDALNVTFNVSNGYASLAPPYPPPFITETKARQCTLWWNLYSGQNAPPNWWVDFQIYTYFRND